MGRMTQWPKATWEVSDVNKAKAIIGIILVFVLGGITGGLATHLVHSHRMESFLKGGGQAREEVIVSRLTRKLALDNRQQEQVRAIVHEDHEAIRQIKKQSQPQIQAIIEQGQARINAMLRPEQQAAFRQIIEERKWRRHRENR